MMETFYFGSNDARLFGVFHKQSGPAELGLLFCQPYGEEMVSSYARFARWAKQLAQERIAVLRFHYRGTGESDGESSEFNLEVACADIEAAVVRLRELIGHSRVGLLGYRLGGTLAARLAAKVGANVVLLWSPVVNLSSYLHEILRMRLTTRLIHQGHTTVKITRDELVRQLETGHCIDVLGYEFSPEFYHQLRTTDPWAVPPIEAQVLWLARSQEGSPGAEKAREWQKAKVLVDYRAVPEIVFWERFPPDLPTRFAQQSVSWLREKLTAATIGAP
jgi:exosortase A-associated hydrolase 2